MSRVYTTVYKSSSEILGSAACMLGCYSPPVLFSAYIHARWILKLTFSAFAKSMNIGPSKALFAWDSDAKGRDLHDIT